MTREEALKTFKKHELHAIYIAVNGSMASGTEIASSSDFDVIGVSVPPLPYYFGLTNFGSDGTKEIRDGDLDSVVYEARKMIRLLSNANPNTIFSLFTRPEDILLCTDAGRLLLDNRRLFLTTKIATTFMGYATSALKKMGAANGPTGDMGAKRKANIEKFGFDCKDASQLVRLLRCGEEILRTGQVNFYRGGIDAEEIKDIKRGDWTLERVQAEADAGFERIRAAEQDSKLPREIDREAVNDLCVEVVRLGLRL